MPALRLYRERRGPRRLSGMRVEYSLIHSPINIYRKIRFGGSTFLTISPAQVRYFLIMREMKDRVQILIRFGVLGIFLNVICSWFFVGVANFSINDAIWIVDDKGFDSWKVSIWPAQGATMVVADLGGSNHDREALDLSDLDLPGWCRFHTLPAYRKGQPIPAMRDMAYGWPWRSLSLSYDMHRSPRFGVMISEEISGALPGLQFPVRVIPLGFLLNSGLFALAGWLLVFTLHAARSALRFRSGRCPDCAESLAKLATEGCRHCGWNVPPTEPTVEPTAELQKSG